MRFISFLALVFAASVPLFSSPVIKGKIDGANAYQKVYLFQFFGNNLLKVDSTQLQNGAFEFLYQNKLPRGFYKIGPEQDKSATIIVGEESFELSFDLRKPEQSLVVSGSIENSVFASFKEFTLQATKVRGSINSEFKRAKDEGNQMGLSQAAVRMDSINEAQNFFLTEIERKYPNSFVAKVAISFIENPNATRLDFFDNLPVNDDELSRSDVILYRVNTYFTRLVPATLEEWENAAKFVITAFPAGSKNREVAYMAVYQLFNAYAKEYSRPYARMYLSEFPESIIAKKINANLPAGPPDVGDKAPDIVLLDPDNKKLPLSTVKGDLILIDFWASWCGPCRKENPNVVKLYSRYKDKGFNIYGVSLDTDRGKWLKAIKDDQLEWEHVSDLKGWKSEGAALYQVRSIPATYLINGKGEIVAKGLRGARLDRFVEDWFKQ